ncbi:MAG: J domain-containing protein [Chloroflexi bacterium]|nr:J domain-containing protein [Chloroflexota bacterium]
MAKDGHLIAHTWTGTLIYVYLLDEPVRVRNLKRILSEGTRVGVGSLFIVDAALVPSDGALTTPDEGLLALHALYRDKVYTYRQTTDGYAVGQVHFKPLGRGSEQEAWYGPDVEITPAVVPRVVKQPQSIRGDWLVANFGTEAFWKQPDYITGRNAFPQADYARSHPVLHVEQSELGGCAGRGVSHPSIACRSPSWIAYEPLGFARCVRRRGEAAFRKLAREFHPDVSKLPKEEAEARFKRLYAAYRYIKTASGS